MTLNIHQMSMGMPTAYHAHCLHVCESTRNFRTKIISKKKKSHLNKIKNIHSNISGGNRLALTSL